MTFHGSVQFRTSSGSQAESGPPGESEIQRLNPAREQRIRHAAGWDRLAPGSLNLAVPDSVVEELARFARVLSEPANQVIYPKGWEHIPRAREEYWYYRARAEKSGIHRDVLVRRAKVPVPGVVELFSADALKVEFNLDRNDILTVEVLAPLKDSDAGA